MMNGHDICTVTPVGPQIMTEGKQVSIGDAEAWYGHADGIVRSSALREVINWMIQTNLRTDFENDSYLDALVLTEVMLDRSTASIKMLAGPSCDTFLFTLQKAFVRAVEKLASSQGKVQILLLDDKTPEFISDVQVRFPDTLEVRLAKIKEGAGPLGHFFVFDSKMARVEKPHEKLTKDTPVNAIQAKVHFNSPGVAQMLETRFGAFWNLLHPHTNKLSQAALASAN